MNFHRRDKDLEDEIQVHLSMARQIRLAPGESKQDADNNVRREFGNAAMGHP